MSHQSFEIWGHNGTCGMLCWFKERNNYPGIEQWRGKKWEMPQDEGTDMARSFSYYHLSLTVKVSS